MVSMPSRVRIRACGLLARPDRADWLLVRDRGETAWRLPGREVTAAFDTPAETVLSAVRGTLGFNPQATPRFCAHTWTRPQHGPPLLTYLFDLGTVPSDLVRPQRGLEVNWVHRVMAPRLLSGNDAVAVLGHLDQPDHTAHAALYQELLT
ncbi:hypothetical protein [Saccharopolyspora sp. NPDC002578]